MMETAVNNSMCRCCASEGAFKDVKSTYHWMGEEEIYADMLRDCFDINLNLSEHCDDGGICEVCITQLRNAINFKKQVLHTEEQFKKHVQNKTLFRPNIVKVEVQGEDDSDDNASGDDGFSGPEYDVPIKTEDSDDPKPKKRSAKATPTRAKKAKTDNGETSTKRSQEKVTKIENNNLDKEALETVIPEKKKRKIPDKKAIRSMNEELKKHQHNLCVILQCSNATIILRHGRIGYVCGYCVDEFPKASDLKNHTLDAHATKTHPTHGSLKTAMSEYCVKLDITNLTCKICCAKLESLDKLTFHLTKEHNKSIYSDIKNHFLPFKFDTERLTCCICFNAYDKFKKLQEHMHIHYRNFICEVCDSGFVNKASLIRHANTHIKGTFPCSFCPKVYDTNVKKKSHERCYHTHAHVLCKCGYCNQGFKDHYSRETHIAKVHGVRTGVYKCSACDKSYSSPKRLAIHVRRDHLLERKHKCPRCDKRFFNSHDVKKHMVLHTGAKDFQCKVCSKSYGRKTTLNSHMRIHNNDRRFKCDVCGQSFVQKCSWKSHMKSRHDEIVT